MNHLDRLSPLRRAAMLAWMALASYKCGLPLGPEATQPRKEATQVRYEVGRGVGPQPMPDASTKTEPTKEPGPIHVHVHVHMQPISPLVAPGSSSGAIPPQEVHRTGDPSQPNPGNSSPLSQENTGTTPGFSRSPLSQENTGTTPSFSRSPLVGRVLPSSRIPLSSTTPSTNPENTVQVHAEGETPPTDEVSYLPLGALVSTNILKTVRGNLKNVSPEEKKPSEIPPMQKEISEKASELEERMAQKQKEEEEKKRVEEEEAAKKKALELKVVVPTSTTLNPNEGLIPKVG